MDNATPAVQVMATAVESWCRDVIANHRDKRLLVVTGPFGCGKTMALKGAARFIRASYMDVWPGAWSHPITDLVVSWPQFNHDYQEGRVAFYGDIHAAHVVFLDDVGSDTDRFRSGASQELLGNLLSDLANHFVFITMNATPKEWRAKWGGRVEDRLHRHATLCNLWEPELGAKSYAL